MAVDGLELHRRAQEILVDALDLEDGERLRWARKRCAGDPDLWREVRSLLAVAVSWGDETTRSALGIACRLPSPPPHRLQGFELVRSLGSGGMGTVGLYRQREPLDREVAIKLVQTGGEAARRLFLSECRMLARLHHPAIAQVFEAGTAPDGRPFMAIEYVPGSPVSDVGNLRQLPIRSRVELLLTVCQAIDHAHQRAILHLDLKPANVLVMDQEGQLLPKVIDFGIGQRLDDETSLIETLAGRLATPAWASPEQLEPPGTTSVSVRTDVYALGLLLYHELTGSLPAKEDPEGAAPRAEDVPHAPSRHIERLGPGERRNVAKERGTSSRALQRALSGDLDAIVLRALRRDPDQRYQSAAALAEDLERWLAGRPVFARPLHPLTRALRTARRNLLLTMVTLGLLVTLAVGLVLVRGQAGRARREAERASRQRARAEQVTRTLVEFFQEADPRQPLNGEPTVRGLVAKASRRLLADSTLDAGVRSSLLSALAEVNMGLGQFESARPLIEEALRLDPSPPEEPSDLETLVLAGNLDQFQGHLEDAEARYVSAHHHAEHVLPERHSLWGRILNDLAYLRRTQGRHREALEGFMQAFEFFPPDSAEAGRVQDNLAGVYYALGRYSEARAAYERALEIKRGALPADHPDFAATITNLAQVNAKTGRFRAAELAYRESLEIMLAHLDADHPEVGISWANLGNLYKAQARLDEAEDAYQRALGIYEKRLEPRDYSIGIVYHGLGDLAVLRSRHPEAIDHYRRALDVYSTSLGAEHRLVAECLDDLGLCRLEAGDVESAARDLGESQRLWRRIFDSTASRRAATGLALTLLDLADLHEIRGEGLLAHTLREEAAGIVPEDDAIANRQLRARIAFLLGRPDARELLREALATGSREFRLVRDARRAGLPL